ncbi:MAG: YggS family pyridoxal phosphate-dependent enzyme [Terriglobales bacterium]
MSIPSLADNLRRVQETVAAASARSGRTPDAVKILGATKTVTPERIREAAALGLRYVGENRVQEREAKRAALDDLEFEWHLLGPLQSNKAAKAVQLFHCVETVDSIALVQRLARIAVAPLPVMLEINIGREPQKHGVTPEDAPALAAAVCGSPSLQLRGIMAVPPAGAVAEAARPYFAALAILSDDLRRACGKPPGVWDLSMGMSQDFAVAIEEGSTLVRLGTALFGSRTHP